MHFGPVSRVHFDSDPPTHPPSLPLPVRPTTLVYHNLPTSPYQQSGLSLDKLECEPPQLPSMPLKHPSTEDNATTMPQMKEILRPVLEMGRSASMGRSRGLRCNVHFASQQKEHPNAPREGHKSRVEIATMDRSVAAESVGAQGLVFLQRENPIERSVADQSRLLKSTNVIDVISLPDRIAKISEERAK